MLAHVVQELQSAKQAVNTQIERLRVELGRIDEAVAILSSLQSTGPVAQVETRKYIKRAKLPKPQVLKAKHHTMSLAARAKIGAAVKARWAKVNAAKVQSQVQVAA